MHRLSKLVVLLTVLAAGGVSVTPVLAQNGSPLIKIRVESILATNAPPFTEKGAIKTRSVRVEMDPRLKQLNVANRLMMMFNYSSYHLLRHQEDNTSLGDAVAFNLPGGHVLHVCPVGFHGNVLMVVLQMFEGERMLMRMPMRIVDDGMLMLVDEHQDNKYYITAITADTPPFRGPSKVQIDPRMSAPVQAFPALIPAE